MQPAPGWTDGRAVKKGHRDDTSTTLCHHSLETTLANSRLAGFAGFLCSVFVTLCLPGNLLAQHRQCASDHASTRTCCAGGRRIPHRRSFGIALKAIRNLRLERSAAALLGHPFARDRSALAPSILNPPTLHSSKLGNECSPSSNWARTILPSRSLNHRCAADSAHPIGCPRAPDLPPTSENSPRQASASRRYY